MIPLKWTPIKAVDDIAICLKDVFTLLYTDENYTNEVGDTLPFADIIEKTFKNPDRVLQTKDRVNDLFNYLYMRYEDWTIFDLHWNVRKEKLEDRVSEQFKKWCSKFCFRFNTTFDRYDALLKYYEQEQYSLLRMVEQFAEVVTNQETEQNQATSNENENEGVNRINDTPQVENADEYLENDPFLSQYQRQNNRGTSSSKSDTTGKGTTNQVSKYATDKDTIMNRLDEIQTKLRNLWADWCDEFKEFFYNDERGIPYDFD